MAGSPSARSTYALGRLTVRPGLAAAPSPLVPGPRPLGLGGRRDGMVVVPPGQPATEGAPLLVALHGAGGTGAQMAELLADAAARRGLVVLAPDARSTTWDVIAGGYGPDVASLDEAIGHVAAQYPVDPAAVAVCGFSDGASYALSLGIANGDLFGRVAAWSPGFAAPATSVGRPRFYVSHGVADRVLPIDRCSRRLVPVLRDDGYDVRYEEFDGGHEVPAAVVERSLDWLAEPR